MASLVKEQRALMDVHEELALVLGALGGAVNHSGFEDESPTLV